MEYKFEIGDSVYHRNLKQYGIYKGDENCFDNECYVEFTDEFGDSDELRVSKNWLNKCDMKK